MADTAPTFAPAVTEPNARTDAPTAPNPGPGLSQVTQVTDAGPPVSEAGPTLAQLKAARRAPAKPTESTQAPVAPAATTEPAAAQTNTEPSKTQASIDMDPAELGKFASLSKEVRTAKQQLKEAQDKLAQYGKFEKVQQLAKEGKHYDAAREAGIDVDAALHDLLGIQAKTPEQSALTELEARTAKALELAESLAKAEQAKADAAAKAAREAGQAKVVSAIQAATDKFPHLGKSTELISMALRDADEAYEKAKADAIEAEVIDKNGDLPDETKNKLLLSTLDRHEQKWAAVFGAKQAAEAAEAKPGIADLRGGVGALRPGGGSKPLTLDEVKQLRRSK